MKKKMKFMFSEGLGVGKTVKMLKKTSDSNQDVYKKFEESERAMRVFLIRCCSSF